MEYYEFMEKVKDQLQRLAEEGVCIKLQKIQKNNGILLKGVSIWKKGENISPTIYLDSFFARYQNGETVETIAREIMDLYQIYRIEEPIDPDFYCDFSNVWDHIVCKVISYEKNRELLKNIPYLRYLDLAIVFYCRIQDEQIGKGTILIHNSHLKLWSITESELSEIAKNNTKNQLPYEFLDLMEVLEKNTDEEEQDFIRELKDQEEIMPMYVLTNKEKNLGAICMVYDSVLSDVGEKLGEDYYILPSSIHECIVIPKKEEIDPEELKIMVREINATQVQPEEVLSDEIYQYERRYHRLSMVLETEEYYPFLEAEIAAEP